MARLTKKTIDAIKPDAKKDVFVWDDKLAGFGLRVKPSGTKSFLLQYRNERGKSKRMTIGKYGKLTPDQARKEAIRLFGSVELGSDPAAQREEARHEWTIKQLCDEYLKQALAGNILTRKGEKKAASTLATDTGRIERHIIPLLGSGVVKDITRQQIMKFYTDVKSGRTATDVVTGVRGESYCNRWSRHC
jgi:Arm domain-containing DNA-binding protein/integrase-like protein